MAIEVNARPTLLAWSHFRSVDEMPAPAKEKAMVGATASLPRVLPVVKAGGRYRVGPFRITVLLDPARTLVEKSLAALPATSFPRTHALRHEQGHLDIVILSTRAMAAAFGKVAEESARDARLAAEVIRETYQRRLQEITTAYDAETDHGSIDRSRIASQDTWSAWIETALREKEPAKIGTRELGPVERKPGELFGRSVDPFADGG